MKIYIFNKTTIIFLLPVFILLGCLKVNEIPNPVTEPDETSEPIPMPDNNDMEEDSSMISPDVDTMNIPNDPISMDEEEPVMEKEFITYSFDAQIEEQRIPKVSVSSYMDFNNNIHIVWIQDDKINPRKLMYTLFNTNTKEFFTQEVSVSNTRDFLYNAPDIVVDNNDIVHIVYHLKRNDNQGTREGNNAVMYATNITGSFLTEQVTQNPLDPTESSEALFNAWVNDRPSIFIERGEVKIIFYADGNDNTSFINFLTFAQKRGNSWDYDRIIGRGATGNGSLLGVYDVSRGVSIPKIINTDTHIGLIVGTGSLDRDPLYLYNDSWTQQIISGYTETLGNRHMQLIEDLNGNTHAFWFTEQGDNERFVHASLDRDNYTVVEEISTSERLQGNFTPATTDLTTGETVLFYHDILANGYIINKKDGNYIETKLDDSEIGVIYGRNNLYSNNNKIALITASDRDNLIYVTMNF